MGISEIVAVAISFASLGAVLLELRMQRKQNRLSALIQLYDSNRDLLKEGLAEPDLLEEIGTGLAPKEERRRAYRQMWMNQMALHFQLYNEGLFDKAQWEAWDADFTAFFENENMREHWQRFRQYYEPRLRAYVDGKVESTHMKKAAAPESEAPPANEN